MAYQKWQLKPLLISIFKLFSVASYRPIQMAFLQALKKNGEGANLPVTFDEHFDCLLFPNWLYR
jgi:hypothetical protein